MTVSKIFDRNNEWLLEQILDSDLDAIGSLAEAGAFELAARATGLGGTTKPAQVGPGGGGTGLGAPVYFGLQVAPGGGMNLSVAAGLGMVSYFSAGMHTVPIYLGPAPAQLTVEGADPGLGRFDLVVAIPALYDAENEVRQVKLVAGGPYVDQAVTKRVRRAMRPGTEVEAIAGDADLFIRKGTPAAFPTPPTLISGEYALAQIYVGAAVGVINAADIADRREAVRASKTAPLWRCIVLGTQAGAFVGDATSLESERAEGGIAFAQAFRNGVGDYTVQLSGFYDPGIGATRTHAWAQVVDAAGAFFAVTSNPTANSNPGGEDGIISVDVHVFDAAAAGAPADADFLLTVEPHTSQGCGLN